MSHRFSALALVLGAFLVTASLSAIWVGATDALLAAAGPKRHLEATALAPGDRGWFELGGCVRHDLAIVVTAVGKVYRLGEAALPSDEGDRVYTPLAERSDCDEERPPRHVFALVEDAEATGTTLGRASRLRVAPPPVPVLVDGTIGPRVGDHGRAARARARLPELPGLADAPLLRKNGRPGHLWVAVVTGTAGLHGLLLLLLGVVYVRRKAARDAARGAGHIDDEEEAFFRSETID